MRIAQLSLAGRGAWPDLHIERIHPQLNVFFGKPGAGKSTVAQLANHLLYGKSHSPWRQQFGQSIPLTEGHLTVESSRGSFILRRYLEADRTSRLTVAGVQGGSVDSRTVQKLLADLSPQVVAQLMAVDFSEAPSVEWLLKRDFTRELAKHQGTSTKPKSSSLESSATTSIDRRRIDELIRQRDAIAESIEKQLLRRRQEGTVLSDELVTVEQQLDAKRRQLDGIHADLRIVAGQIAECETRLRFLALETLATRRVAAEQNASRQQELAALEDQITRCRKAIGDLQAREAVVRAGLAQVSPDGTTDRVTYLADSRATLGVLEKLIDDLDAEVALLARSHEPSREISFDSHTNLTPVAAMLRQQVYTLCGLVTEQERHARRQQLTTESRQITRSQLDLSERLEHLLERREMIARELAAERQAVLLRPQTPSAQHCQCEHHGEFIQKADPLLVGFSERHSQESSLRGHYEELLRRRGELQNDVETVGRQIADLEAQWQRIQRERAGMVGNASLEQQQFELERLDITIREALKPVAANEPVSLAKWRASDILAELTDGRLVQIRLERDGRPPVVINNLGQAIELSALSTGAHDQLYLALTLALVGSFSRRGIHLPLVLDEPFLRQEAAGSAAMAGVLAEFARAGHQVLVFTEDSDALRRFESLNSQVFDLARVRRQPASVPVENIATAETTLTRFVRETEDGKRTPILQFTGASSTPDALFYLTETSSLAQFPVLGSGTMGAFARINIENVGQLLASEPAAIAKELNRKEITADTVALWQAHMRLMCSIPGLTLNDAQVLTACGIRSLAELRKSVPIELEATIRDFLRSDRGQRFAGTANHFNASQIREWVHLGTHSVKPTTPKAQEKPIQEKPQRQSAISKTRLRAVSSETTPPRFYLHRNSSVADAPSIGPKTVKLLESVGIRTVADLLQANAASVAAELAQGHLTASTVADWQIQARLMCQIPDLRGYGAQLLVASGFTSAEQVANTRAAELIRKVQAICQSKQGQRILRDGEIPSPTKIKRWAESAAHRRPLEAA